MSVTVVLHIHPFIAIGVWWSSSPAHTRQRQGITPWTGLQSSTGHTLHIRSKGLFSLIHHHPKSIYLLNCNYMENEYPWKHHSIALNIVLYWSIHPHVWRGVMHVVNTSCNMANTSVQCPVGDSTACSCALEAWLKSSLWKGAELLRCVFSECGLLKPFFRNHLPLSTTPPPHPYFNLISCLIFDFTVLMKMKS